MRSDAARGVGNAEPSHPVDLASLSADHVPDPASEGTPRGSPAAARAAPGSETRGDRHSGSVSQALPKDGGEGAPLGGRDGEDGARAVLGVTDDDQVSGLSDFRAIAAGTAAVGTCTPPGV